ncbi:uncharacterized protein G2W53_002920 [Senna tora]|uniref:Uncharacterized protein n=1 Tax=Senna tora TaxID=362788 RepID=A0A834XA88_9FABA|nr:uncharacterized protein G2W53_002920 [Senna tora]
MASEAPSWADQWGAGGIGAMEDEENRSQKDTEKKDKNSDAKGGFFRNGVKWIKNQFISMIEWQQALLVGEEPLMG